MIKLAVIGGSGFDKLTDFTVHKEEQVETPYGMPSSIFLFGDYKGLEIVFLPRHGSQHSIPPHGINYRANLYALKSIGITEVIAFAAVGGITSQYPSLSVAIPHQLIDYSWGREHTFYDGRHQSDSIVENQIVHIDFTQPFDQQLRTRLLAAAQRADISYTGDGVYAVTQGPRLETAAEIDRLEKDGANLVGMTIMPEAALAKELGLAYACIALVVNEAAGRGSDELTMDAIFSNLGKTTSLGLAILDHFI